MSVSEDRSGWDRVVAAAKAIDGLGYEVGILDDPEVARYGLVWEVRRGWLVVAFDELFVVSDSALQELASAIFSEVPAEQAAEIPARKLRAKARDMVEARGLVETGRLLKEIGARRMRGRGA